MCVCWDYRRTVTGYLNPADDRYDLTTRVTGTEADGDDVEFTDVLSSYMTTSAEPAEPRLLLINRVGAASFDPVNSPPSDMRWRHLYRHARRPLHRAEPDSISTGLDINMRPSSGSPNREIDRWASCWRRSEEAESTSAERFGHLSKRKGDLAHPLERVKSHAHHSCAAAKAGRSAGQPDERRS